MVPRTSVALLSVCAFGLLAVMLNCAVKIVEVLVVEVEVVEEDVEVELGVDDVDEVVLLVIEVEVLGVVEVLEVVVDSAVLEVDGVGGAVVVAVGIVLGGFVTDGGVLLSTVPLACACVVVVLAMDVTVLVEVVLLAVIAMVVTVLADVVLFTVTAIVVVSVAFEAVEFVEFGALKVLRFAVLPWPIRLMNPKMASARNKNVKNMANFCESIQIHLLRFRYLTCGISPHFL